MFCNVKQSIPRPNRPVYMHLTVPQNKQQKLKEETDSATAAVELNTPRPAIR